MAYSNGIFHIDLVSGSDAARTALTSCVASNPSGSITRIAKTAHGLTTGAVVDLTSFTAWLNGAWKITVVDADNFDLDTAVWEATADPNGTVTPRGGSSWADAWLTIGSGATAARIQPGDNFKISKTEDPVSFGINATWTNESQTVTLASALSKKVEDAETGWTAATNITVATTTNRKIGATAITITPGAAFTTGKMAYKAIAGGGTQDFSAYTHINFWLRPTSNALLPASTYRIILCSDTTGDTPVSVFNIPAMQANTGWQPVSIDYGGALSASVQSVAIYAILDPGTVGMSFNNIFTSNGELSLKNLIGKNGEEYYAIQSVDDLNIKLDSNNTTASGRGYYGSTSTETLYYRVPLTVNAPSSWAVISEAGNTSFQKCHYEGGWNTGTDIIDGYTAVVNSILGVGTVITMSTFTKLSNFIFSRFNTFSTSDFTDLENIVLNSFATTMNDSSRIDCLVKNVKFLNTANTPGLSGSVIFENCQFLNGTFYGITSGAGQKFVGCTFANNTTSAMLMGNFFRYSDGATILRNCIVDQTTEVSSTVNRTGYIWSFDHDNTAGNHWAFTYGGTINWQTSVKNTGAVGSWRVSISQSTRTIYQPVSFKIAEIAVAASSLVTVNIWVKKDHATNIAASIYVEDAAYNINGVAAMTDTKADDTSWEELTLTFTPTEAGIVPIYASAWYVAGNSDAYFGPITVTQA